MRYEVTVIEERIYKIKADGIEEGDAEDEAIAELQDRYDKLKPIERRFDVLKIEEEEYDPDTTIF